MFYSLCPSRPVFNRQNLCWLLTVVMLITFSGQFLFVHTGTIAMWRFLQAVFWVVFLFKSCLSHQARRTLRVLGLVLAVTILPWFAHAGTVLFCLPTLMFLQGTALAMESRFARVIGQTIDGVQQQRPLAFLLGVHLLIGVAFVAMYASISAPTATPFRTPAGNLQSQYPFFGWWDQSCYYYMVKRMACWEWFSGGYAGGFYYGPGYPALAAPFYFWLSNPFLPQMFITYLLVFSLLHRILSHFLCPSLALSGLIFLLVSTPLSSPFFGHGMLYASYLLIPWNNAIPILGGAYFTCLVLTDKSKRPAVTACLIGLLFGLVFAARYGDILYLFPLALYALVRHSDSIGKFLKFSLLTTLASLIPAGLTLYLHSKYYGKMTLTYLNFVDFKGYEFFWPTDFSRVLSQLFHVVVFSDLVSCSPPEAAMPLLCMLPIGVFVIMAWPAMKTGHRSSFHVILFSLLASLYYYGSNLGCNPLWLEHNCLRYLMPLSIPATALGVVGVFQRLADDTESTKAEGGVTFRPVAVGALLLAICLPPLLIPKYSKLLRDQLLGVETVCHLQPSPASLSQSNRTLLQLSVPGRPNRNIRQFDLTDSTGHTLSSTVNGTLIIYNNKLQQLDLLNPQCLHPGLVCQDTVFYMAPFFASPATNIEVKAAVFARDILLSNRLTVSMPANKRHTITLLPSRVFDVNTPDWVGIYQSPWIPVETNRPVQITAKVKIHRLQGEMRLDFCGGIGQKWNFPDQRTYLRADTTFLASFLRVTQEVGAVRLRFLNRGSNYVEITDLQTISQPVSDNNCDPPLVPGKTQAH